MALTQVKNIVSGLTSDGVTYTQGATNSSTRAIGDKLRESVSVLDFIPENLHAGIKAGTNTTALHTYIQAAITHCGLTGKRLYFPAGIYLVTDTISIPQYTNMYGEYNYQGWNDSTNTKSTIIQFTPATPKSLFVTSTANGTSDGFISFISIKNMCLFGDSSNAQAGIFADKLIYSGLNNLKIWYFQLGVQCAQTISNRIENVLVGYCSVACVSYSTATCTTDVWDQCTFNNAPIGIDTEQVAIGIRFNNCLFEDLDTYGANLVKESAGFVFNNCYSENVPKSNAAGTAMFNVGVDGTTVGVVSALTIIGGEYQGSTTYTSTAGTWMNVDDCYSVKIVSPHVHNIHTVIRASATTKDNAISVFGNSQQSIDTFYSGPTGKVVGVVARYSLNNGSGNLEDVFVREVNSDTLYVGTDNLYVGSDGNVGLGTTSPTVVASDTTNLTLFPKIADRWSVVNLIGNRDYGGNQNGIVNFINQIGTRTIVAAITSKTGAASAVEGNLVFSTKIAAGTLTDVMEVTSGNDVKVLNAGNGIILKTPDGTKNYRLAIDNAGAVTTTML